MGDADFVQYSASVVQAQQLEKAEVESKLVKLRELLKQYGIFEDPKMKLVDWFDRIIILAFIFDMIVKPFS